MRVELDLSAPFEQSLRTRVVFGEGAIARLGELACELGATRVFLVSSPGVAAAGHAVSGERALAASGLEVCVDAQTPENPTDLDVAASAERARAFGPDLLVGLGGGSALDTTKGVAFLLAGGGAMEDYWGQGKARGELLPFIAVPTTAGTGSETQSYALISRAADKKKMACGDPQAAARVALLDPVLSLSQPPAVTASAGLDTLGHALESAVTRARTPVSVLYSLESFRLASAALERIFRSPDDLAARGEMLLAAAWAGVAIEHSMLGAAHALANPLTARHGVVHGQAVALCLPHVVRFNAEDAAVAARYAQLARAAALVGADGSDAQAAEALALRVERLRALGGVVSSLGEVGIDSSELPELAGAAANEWTGGFNPRATDAAQLQRLYERALAVGARS